jgi:hypothetical protein
VDYFKDHPLYDLADLDALAVEQREPIAAVVDARLAWTAMSVTVWDVSKLLGWSCTEFERVARQRDIRADHRGRYARVDVEGLADDATHAQVVADRLLGPDQAADYIDIRRTDFDYLVRAGVLEPASNAQVVIGRGRVTVNLYRRGDLDAVAASDLPGVDWSEVRECRPGDLSPLRRLVS